MARWRFPEPPTRFMVSVKNSNFGSCILVAEDPEEDGIVTFDYLTPAGVCLRAQVQKENIEEVITAVPANEQAERLLEGV